MLIVLFLKVFFHLVRVTEGGPEPNINGRLFERPDILGFKDRAWICGRASLGTAKGSVEDGERVPSERGVCLEGREP